MNCAEAQHLLNHDDQISSAALGRQLTTHLSVCPDCGALRDRGLLERLILGSDDDWLLRALLRSAPSVRRSSGAWLRRGALAALLIVALIVGWRAVQTAIALRTIQRNVGAMIVAPRSDPQVEISADQTRSASLLGGALLPTPIPAGVIAAGQQLLVTPTLTASPSPTPLPTDAPTLTPTLVPTAAPTLTPTDPPVPGQQITMLLLGTDDSGARTDSILVAHVDLQTGRVALLSFTRDLIVEIPGVGYGRINTASVYGGPELARQTVSNLLHVPIDYYALVNFDGFRAAIDAIGGITVNVEKEVEEPGWIHAVPGPMTLDGEMALRYSRVRKADSDYERVKRQQTVIVGIANRVRDAGMLESVQRLADLTSALQPYVQTDLPQDQMLGLAWALRDLKPDAIERYALGAGTVSEGAIPGDPYAQIAQPGVIDALAQQLMNGNQ